MRLNKGQRIRVVIGALWFCLIFSAVMEQGFLAGLYFLFGLGILIIFAIDIWHWINAGDD